MIFVGVDWAEAHHDVCVLDSEGRVLVRGSIRRERIADLLHRDLMEIGGPTCTFSDWRVTPWANG